MVKDVIGKLKEFIVKFKNSFGDTVGKYLLQCTIIAVAIIVLINIIAGVKVSLWGIIEWILSIPVFSIIVILVRMALKFVHIFLPQGGIIRLAIDIIVSLVVIKNHFYIVHFLKLKNKDDNHSSLLKVLLVQN